MTSSSASLQKYPNPKSGGLSDLPPTQRTVLEQFAKAQELPYSILCQQVIAILPTLDQQQIDDALYALMRLGFVASFFEDGEVVYLLQATTFSQLDKRDETAMRRPSSSARRSQDLNQ